MICIDKSFFYVINFAIFNYITPSNVYRNINIVNNWFRWCETRNRLSYEYPDNEAERFAAILAAITAAAELAEGYQHWRAMLIKKCLSLLG